MGAEMTVGELKQLLDRYEDDVKVCVGSPPVDGDVVSVHEIEGTGEDEVGVGEICFLISAGEELPPL
jgi:hypothetical protein